MSTLTFTLYYKATYTYFNFTFLPLSTAIYFNLHLLLSQTEYITISNLFKIATVYIINYFCYYFNGITDKTQFNIFFLHQLVYADNL